MLAFIPNGRFFPCCNEWGVCFGTSPADLSSPDLAEANRPIVQVFNISAILKVSSASSTLFCTLDHFNIVKIEDVFTDKKAIAIFCFQNDFLLLF